MPLDPHLAGLLQLVEAGTPMSEQTVEESRAAFRALAVGFRTPEHVVGVKEVAETNVPGAAGDLPARVYRPEGEGPFATVGFFHGGGFVVGDLDTHDNMARAICRGASAVVVSVDYRLAPEDGFPAGVEDAVTVTRWLKEHLDEFGGDDRLAVAGDSAGGNLSAVAAQEVPGLAAQLLMYPATDVAGDYPSRTENAEGYFLDLPTMTWFIGHYLAEGADPTDPRLSPIRAESLAGLPPAMVATAEFDPLRDEGEAYAAALADAGVRVDVQRYAGMIHGFMDMGPFSPAAQAGTDDAIARFAALLNG
jgi:acetyl esterase